MSTLIKRLSQNGQEFVPITLSEAVVVNSTNIPSLQSLGITTLDKVLISALSLINGKVSPTDLQNAVNAINANLEKKQDKLTAGQGIKIDTDGTISCTVSLELYKVVAELPDADITCLNKIYLKKSSDVSQNLYKEYVCVEDKATGAYSWEEIGNVKTDIDLSGYVKVDDFNSEITRINTQLDKSITAVDVTTSSGTGSKVVIVSYDIPETLYDSAVSTDLTDNITQQQ